MSQEKTILVMGHSLKEYVDIMGKPPAGIQLTFLNDILKEVDYDREKRYDGLFVTGDLIDSFVHLKRYIDGRRFFDILPVGVVTIGEGQRVLETNRQFDEWVDLSPEECVGKLFYDLLGNPDVDGRCPSPFFQARSKKKPAQTVLRNKERGQYFQIDVRPIYRADDSFLQYIVILRDIKELTAIDTKLKALQDAGKQLGNLTKKDLLSLSVDERIDLLKAQIIAFAEDFLHYDKIEIRLLSTKEEGLLEPLLAVGMEDEAARRKLYAHPEGNGVTGFVAYHGTRYLVEDANEDPLYIRGATDARSSMTVPLMVQGHVIGTFNVESTEPGAFSTTDIEFLEYFAREVAQTIHTLDLLSIEQSGAAFKGVEAVHAAVALPINTILNTACSLLSDQTPSSGCRAETNLVEGLSLIQKEAREIQKLIQKIGSRMTPSQAHPVPPGEWHPLLKNKRILVVDVEESTGIVVNSFLFRYGCIIESAANATQALLRVQAVSFDAIISDINLKDMDGFEFFLRLKKVIGLPFIPMIFAKGFGYDPAHITVKARQEGVIGFISKPLIMDQLISNIEKVIEESIRQNGEPPNAEQSAEAD